MCCGIWNDFICIDLYGIYSLIKLHAMFFFISQCYDTFDAIYTCHATLPDSHKLLKSSRLEHLGRCPFIAVRPSVFHREPYDFVALGSRNCGSVALMSGSERRMVFGRTLGFESDTLSFIFAISHYEPSFIWSIWLIFSICTALLATTFCFGLSTNLCL